MSSKPSEVREALTGNSRTLFDALFGGGDVPIANLFSSLYGTEELVEHADNPRHLQMIVGSRVSYLNRRLEALGVPLRVRPGALKRTYCLYRL